MITIEKENGTPPSASPEESSAPYHRYGRHSENTKMLDRYQEKSMSVFKNAFGETPIVNISLQCLFDEVKNGAHKTKVEAIRSALKNGASKDDIKRLKVKLNTVSISGCITTGERKKAMDERRFQHSGLLQIDIDGNGLGIHTPEEIREILANDPYIACSFISPSGRGTKAVMVIPICKDEDEHKNAFLTAEDYLKNRYQVEIDQNTKDTARLCFVSYDPNGWMNESAIPLPIPERKPEPQKPKTANPYEYDNHELDRNTVREMLAVIPPRPDYNEWLRISSAVWDAVGQEVGTDLLMEWSAEEKSGEYSDKFKHRFNDVKAGTLVYLALENGYKFPRDYRSKIERFNTSQKSSNPSLEDIHNHGIPDKVFPIPCGEITYEDAGSKIFSVIADTKTIFMRDMTPCEVVQQAIDGATLRPLEPERFIALLDGYGYSVRRRELKKPSENKDAPLEVIWRKSNFPLSYAKTLFSTEAARRHLPKISRILSAPIIIDGEDGFDTILQKGYHEHGGGTLITKGSQIPVVPLNQAVEMLQSLLEDFNFSTPSDRSRAMASFISPALKFGDLLQCDYPIDFAEADQSQSGKTYRQKLVCAIYNEKPSVITEPKGGVGSLDESISGALIAGKPFLTIDNLRSKLDSTILETATRGHGTVQARALRISTTIETRHYLWQISTNGAELTRDAANRCVVTKITKRPATAKFKTFPEGDLLQHVKKKQNIYLGCVFAIVREWIRQGKQRSNESRHDFREWTQCLDCIITEICKMPPLMDGHREEQLRTANPNLQWLRLIAIAAVRKGEDYEFSASTIAELGEDEGIELPRRGNEPKMVVGRIMSKLFTEAESNEITVERITITRTEREAKDDFGNYRPAKFYHFHHVHPEHPKT
jgi:hypothetical protein